MPNRHFWLGRGVHYALAAYYGHPERTPESLMLAWNAWAERELTEIAGLGVTPAQFAELEEARDLGEGVLRHYVRWAQINDDFRVVMPETQFKVPLPGLDALAG